MKILKKYRIYNCSKGIKRPKVERMIYKEAKERVQDMAFGGSNVRNVIQVTENLKTGSKRETIFNTIKKEEYIKKYTDDEEE